MAEFSPLRDYFITARIDDLSTADQVYIPIPVGGRIVSVKSCIANAITVADATLTLKNSGGTSKGTATVANSGSAAGDVDTITPSSPFFVATDSFIEVETDGGSTTACEVILTVQVRK